MKTTLFTFLFLFAISITYAQSPNQINYQGIARDASGNPLPNQAINLNFEIKKSGVSFYTSTSQNVTTNAFGLFNTTIGSSTSPLPSYGWESGNMTLIVTINGSALPAQPLNTVPYSLFANDVNSNLNAGVLTIGSKNYTLNTNSSTSVTGNGLATVTSPSTNAFVVTVAVPSITFTPTGNILSLTFGANTYTSVINSNLQGDVTGTANSNTVVALRNTPISTTTPTLGQILQYNGTNWSPANFATGGVTSVSGSFPLTGTVTNAGSIGMQTVTSSGSYGSSPNVVPTLVVDSWGRVTSAGQYTLSSPTLSGNVLGNPTSNTVVAIQNTPVSTITPTGGQVLTYSSGVWVPTTQNFAAPILSLNGSTLQSGPATNTVNLSGLLGNAWLSTGNSAVSPTNNIFGSINNNDISIITNNIARIGINSSTITNAGGVVIGGNTAGTSLGKDLTLQGPLLSTSDQTYGQMAIRGGSNLSANQSFLSMTTGPSATVLGYLGDKNTTDNDITLHGQNNLRLSSGSFTSPAMFIEGSSNNIAVGGFTNPVSKLEVQTTNSTSAVNGINFGSGAGIKGQSNGSSTNGSAHGVYGESNSTAGSSAGVKGVNLGIGASIVAEKVGTSTGIGLNVIMSNTSNTSGTGIVVDHNGQTNQGMQINMNNALNSFQGLLVNHLGTGPGIISQIQNPSNINPALQAITNATGINSHAIFAEANSNTASGIFATNRSTGPALSAIKSATQTGFSLEVKNNNSSNPNTALYVESNSNSSTAGTFVNMGANHSFYAYKTGTNPGASGYFQNLNNSNGSPNLFSETNGLGSAIQAVVNNSTNNNSALQATSNSNTSYAGSFINSGNGASLYAGKFGVGTGSSAYFENTNTANGFSTLFCSTNGSGVAGSFLSSGTNASMYSYKSGSASGSAAVFENSNNNNSSEVVRINNLSNINTSVGLNIVSSGNAPTALKLSDGHLNVTGPALGSISSGFGSGFTYGSTGSNDMAGTIEFVGGVGSIPALGTGSLSVSFGKNYPTKPVVVVSALSPEWAKVSSYVVSSISGFTIFFTNNLGTSISLNAGSDAFSYIVIGMN